MNKYPIPPVEGHTLRQITGKAIIANILNAMDNSEERGIYRDDRHPPSSYWVGDERTDSLYGPFIDMQSAFGFKSDGCPWPIDTKQVVPELVARLTDNWVEPDFWHNPNNRSPEPVPNPRLVTYKLLFQEDEYRRVLAAQVNNIAKSLHGLAREVGHWTDLHSGQDITVEALEAMPEMEAVGWIASKLLMIHGETSEGAEGYRRDLMDDKLPKHKMLACELADAAIRVFDLAMLLGYDIGQIIAEKSAFNAYRKDHTLDERRANAHGKKF